MSTPPRRVLPGKTQFVTRRCSERRFFLRPSRRTNEIFLYILALAAERHHVLVHAFCVMSNHFHLVVTDIEGRLPAFMQYLNSLVARAVNASIGHGEGFWASNRSYSAVEPLAPSDVLAKIAYVLANPVAAGLVKRGAEWPGLWSAPEQIGTRLTVRKPKEFFDPNGDLPATVELELTVPSGFGSAEEFRAQLAAALDDLEAKHRRELESQGRRFLGAARVSAQNPFSRPRTSGPPWFELDPKIAARDPWRRIEGIFRVKSFEKEYRASRTSWCAGLRDVVFPAGTYLMRIMYGVQCAGAA